MAALGGMLAAAILKVVGDQIGAAIAGQIKLQKDFDKDLKKMKMSIESVEAVLEDAQRRSITDRSTLLWLKRLKDAMYAISDTIDEFEADTEVISQPSAKRLSFKKHLDIMIPCLTIGSKIIVANKMEKMREDLEVITDQHKKFKLVEGTNTSEPKVTNIRETSSTLERHIIGRDEEKVEILSSLYGTMTEAITILPIYGIAGLGKTTLAKMVFDSPQFKEYSHVWVYVSQAFDLKNIGNSIISQLSEEGEESDFIGMQMIHNSLQKLLTDKKILIVLDDLWEGEEFHLESLTDMLMVGRGSNVVVLVTTRDEGIANKISTIQPYRLAPLSDDICWSIIKQTCKFDSRADKEQLENIGKVIAMKCGGIALAAKSLGHMLQSMKPIEWESVRDSNIWTASSLRDTSSSQVLASLKLSYSVMPSHLKLCFAYCAIFPKGHKIVKDDLIHQWVSLGFSTLQLGERYISQLLGLSFLEHAKSTLTTNVYGDITLLTMHDLVHDLARSAMDDEILVTGKDDNAVERCYRYALLDDCSKPLGLESSKTRALRFMECDKIELHDAAFSSAKSLRVLDLSECIIHKLADCISELKQLRYLNIPRVQGVEIADSIAKLSKLIYLNLHGSRILALPESIGETESLMYLDLSGCSGIEKLPESFRRLKELVHLNLSNCSSVGGISVFLESLTQLQYLNLSDCPNIGELPEALGGLSKLQYLNLSFSSYIESCDEAEVLGALTKLEYLNLSSYYCPIRELPETLGRFIQLKYLDLSGCQWLRELPRFFGLKCLQYLNLALTSIISLPDGLTKLKYLNLSWSIGAISEDIFESLLNHICSNLSDLEHLDLSYNYYLTSIPESISNLTKLHTLDLSGCYRLCEIPNSVVHSLKFLYLMDCHFNVQPGYGDSGSNLVQLQSIDTDGLLITELENVMSVREAQCIKLLEKKKLKELALEWTRDVDKFVDDRMLLENLVPPRTLEHLEICGYNGVSFPSWLVDQLPKLKSVVLRDMANLEELDTSSYTSGEEHVIERLEIHDCPMLKMKPLPPRASIWKISNSDNVLSSWEECGASHTNASSSSSPVTTELSIYRSRVPVYQWRLLQHLCGLSYLTIDNCGDLTCVKTLCLENEDLKEVPKLIGDQTSLQYLVIRGCRGLEGLYENMGQLTKLKSLQLCYCNNLESLPHWLGELTSLMQLVIHRCDVFRSLPESIQQLLSLRKIDICFCPELKHVVESEEGKTKHTHNRKRVCLLPVSLEKLVIVYCESIKSLPDGIQHLTNLQTLQIESCPKLEKWCELKENKMKLAHIEIKH